MIIATPHLTDSDRLELAKLLLKAGYTVRIRAEKIGNKSMKVIELEEHA